MAAVLIAGCGDIGIRTGLLLAAAGHAVRGFRRRPGPLLPDLALFSADLENASELRRVLAGVHCDYVLVTAAAGQFSAARYRAVYVEGLRNLLAALEGAAPRRIFLVSSSRVYQQDRGEWVDEESITVPQGFAGQHLLEAENLLQESGFPCCTVRCSGIYGPGRRGLLRRLQEGVGCPRTPPLYTNRIHADDCARVLAHLLQLDATGVPLAPCYLATDSRPAPLHEVMSWLAARMGVELGTQTVPAGRTGSGKRCRNRRLLDSGYHFLYPSYREGYGVLLRSAAEASS